MKYATLTALLLVSLLSVSWLDKPKQKTLKIAVISDLNSSYGSTEYHTDVYATLKELDSIKPDIILCGGDKIAGQKTSITRRTNQSHVEQFR